MACLSFLRGGIEFSNFTKKDISNVRTRFRAETGENDMQQVRKFFTNKQADDPMFFFTFDTDEENRVRNMFWSHAASRFDYDQYGDVLSFDTTYETNRYNLKFAPFVGINGHGQNILFAGAFISDETIETFKWLFRVFLKCMAGRAPKTIITDQDAAMRTAIREELPNTVHRNCLFHVIRNAELKCGQTFANKDADLVKNFYDIIFNSLTVREFEELWNNMMDKYEIRHIRYFQHMFETRKHYIPVFFKTQFLPFIQTTARSEGTNAIFKDNIGPTSTALTVVQEYERIKKSQEHDCIEQDKNKCQTAAVLHSEYYFERQARDLYNTNIFYKFQQIVKEIGKYEVLEIEKNKKFEVVKSQEHAKMEFRSRKYLVLVDILAENYACICGMFQKDGILCAHILSVLIRLNKHRLPEKYFIDRWRPALKKTNTEVPNPEALIRDNSTLRYNILSRKLVSLASAGAESVEKYKYLCKEAQRLCVEVKSIPAETEINSAQETLSMETNISVSSTIETNIATTTSAVDIERTQILCNPAFIKSKGRPVKIGNTRRMMPTAEIARVKSKITCSHCGGNDHYITTCDKLDMQFPPRKKTKKAATRKDNAKAGMTIN